MSPRYVVASYTHGSFREWATDVLDDLGEATAFVADPPPIHAPRPQDELRIFEVSAVEP